MSWMRLSVENSGVASEYLLPRGEVGDSLNKSGSMSPGSPRDHKHFTGPLPFHPDLTVQSLLFYRLES